MRVCWGPGGSDGCNGGQSDNVVVGNGNGGISEGDSSDVVGGGGMQYACPEKNVDRLLTLSIEENIGIYKFSILLTGIPCAVKVFGERLFAYHL